MREIVMAILAVGLAAPVMAADNPQMESAIKSVVARVDGCINANDSKCLGALFTEDATFGGPLDAGRIYAGRSAVVGAFEKMMKGPRPEGVKQVRTVEKIRAIGADRALVDASVKLEGLKEAAGARQDWHSTMLMKSVDGAWLLEDVRFYVVVVDAPPTPGPTPPKEKGPAEGEAPAAPDAAKDAEEAPGDSDTPGEPAPPDMG